MWQKHPLLGVTFQPSLNLIWNRQLSKNLHLFEAATSGRSWSWAFSSSLNPGRERQLMPISFLQILIQWVSIVLTCQGSLSSLLRHVWLRLSQKLFLISHFWSIKRLFKMWKLKFTTCLSHCTDHYCTWIKWAIKWNIDECNLCISLFCLQWEERRSKNWHFFLWV